MEAGLPITAASMIAESGGLGEGGEMGPGQNYASHDFLLPALGRSRSDFRVHDRARGFSSRRVGS